ncbi:MAG: hypothetical protein JWQ27_3123 [Ferruginibacter sp.]|nr:hypothetical protein [Ferruginibacter sp.]
MKTILTICSLLFMQAAVIAADGEFAIAKINPALLKNANAVVRLEETYFEILNTKETVTKHRYVISILNENGDRWADMQEYYDKHHSTDAIEGILYDASGRQIKKIKKKDTEDYSGVSGGTLIDDNRIRHHNFYYRAYPYTVEYTIELSDKATLFFPQWDPQGGEFLAVEKSSMSVFAPAGYTFRYKAFNYAGEPVTVALKNGQTSTWAVKDLPAIKRESFSPLWHDLVPLVIFGPSDFQMDDYKGNMQTWSDFGKFVYALKQGRDVLPDQVKTAVHAIADPLPDPKEKIAALYKYMQKNTRYISIQLGIGGWQPFEAKDVAAKGYGDCKALTNYMYSLLKEAGITSYYSLIRAGSNANYITTDFPSQQFNHVILCVPVAKDSIWLECTSQTMPPGYLGDFTADRPSLLIDQNGGKLVRTPKYGLADNIQSRNIEATLAETGDLRLQINTLYGGMSQDDLHGLINGLSKDKVREYLSEQLSFSTYTVNKFDYTELRNGRLPAIREELDILATNYATITGKRLFIVPNVMTRARLRLAEDSNRKYAIRLSNELSSLDTVSISLPDGYTAESIPADIAFKNQFGSYKASIRLKENKLIYYRQAERYSGEFKPADYAELVKLNELIYKADQARVVLLKN